MGVEGLDGVERRRRWADERRLSILMEVGLRGATATEVARRHAVSRRQLHTWRRELRRHGALRPVEPSDGRPGLVPVAPPPRPAPMTGPEPAGMAAPGPMPDPATGSGGSRRDRAGERASAARAARASRRRRSRASSGSRRGRDRARHGGAGLPGLRDDGQAQGHRRPVGAGAGRGSRQPPTSGAVFAFRGRRGDGLKRLRWDGRGLGPPLQGARAGALRLGPRRRTASRGRPPGEWRGSWEGIDRRRPHRGAPPARVG